MQLWRPHSSFCCSCLRGQDDADSRQSPLPFQKHQDSAGTLPALLASLPSPAVRWWLLALAVEQTTTCCHARLHCSRTTWHLAGINAYHNQSVASSSERSVHSQTNSLTPTGHQCCELTRYLQSHAFQRLKNTAVCWLAVVVPIPYGSLHRGLSPFQQAVFLKDLNGK